MDILFQMIYESDIFISKNNIGKGLHQDTVKVFVYKRKKWKKK
jgi:ribonuclease R/exosome complex exonuclease DIS3/RRP44